MEVVSADSMQVYKWMDIGTAKPSTRERENLPHWLIDILPPDSQFDLGDFVGETDRLVEEIHRRGSIPVISGGTAYYFRHYLVGLPETPEVTEDIRLLVRQMQEVYSNEKLMKILRRVDPVSAERIHLNDSYRISRALEVFYASGRALSSFPPPRKIREGISPLIIGLRRPRKELYDRINRRVRLMIDEGLIGELERLISMGYGPEDPGLKGIGYREFFSKGTFLHAPLETIIREIQKNSRRYAKRQITFFSSLEKVEWFHPDAEGEIFGRIESSLDIL